MIHVQIYAHGDDQGLQNIVAIHFLYFICLKCIICSDKFSFLQYHLLFVIGKCTSYDVGTVRLLFQNIFDYEILNIEFQQENIF